MLNERQQRFVDYFIELGKAYPAALKAGYSENYAKAQACKLLENDGIKNEIDSKLEKLKSKRIATATEVMEYLTSVLRGELQEEVVVVVGCGEGYSEARVINKQVSAKERNKAAELLAKRYGLQTDKVQLEVKPVIIGGADALED